MKFLSLLVLLIALFAVFAEAEDTTAADGSATGGTDGGAGSSSNGSATPPAGAGFKTLGSNGTLSTPPASKNWFDLWYRRIKVFDQGKSKNQ